MPIYEYKCTKCNRAFSVLQRVGATEKDTVCTECGSNAVTKLLSAFSCSSLEGKTFSTSAPARGFGGG